LLRSQLHEEDCAKKWSDILVTNLRVAFVSFGRNPRPCVVKPAVEKLHECDLCWLNISALAVISCQSNPNVIVGRALATFVARVEYAARLN
jgi:hypothetical protein